MKVINTKEEWENILKNFENTDIFFTYDFLEINTIIEPGRVEAIYYEDESLRFFYPYIRRPFNNLPYVPDKYRDYSDITSPYGACGPLFKGDVRKIFKKLRDYFTDTKTVSEFVRFHPLIENHIPLSDYYDLLVISPLVYMDFSEFNDTESIFKSFNENVRRNIRFAEKNNFEFLISNKIEDIKIFYDVYINTLKVKQGERRHFFPFEFFKEISTKDFSSFYFIFKDKNILSSGLFLKYNIFSHYFLGGLSEEGYKTKGSTHFLFWCFIKENFKKFRYFSLGGGRGKPDSLLDFKRGFSKKEKDYIISKKIYFHDIYKELTFEFIKYKDIKDMPTLFPQYRDI